MKKKNGLLQLSREDMRTLGYQIIDVLVDHYELLHCKSVTRKKGRKELEKKLAEAIPEKGVSFKRILEELQGDVFFNMMYTNHPRFFAFVPSPSNFVSVMADTLATGFNVYSGIWLESSGPTVIELVTLGWLRQLLGLPESAQGLFVSGGSVANLTGLAVARHVGLGNRVQNSVSYCSDQTHSSINKGLNVLGFEPSQLKRIPSDMEYIMDVESLKRAVEKDKKSGKKPFCVIANAGTVNTGAIDPLKEMADFCKKENLWLHVDGAYGAAAILSDKARCSLAGMDLADSITVDPHKWLFQPYEMGCIFVKNAQFMKDTFYMMPEYLKDAGQTEEEINFCDYGIQLTRRFRALKLWMSLKVFGLIEFKNAINRGIELAEVAESVINEFPRFEVVTHAQLGILTFRYFSEDLSHTEVDTLNQNILNRMISDGFAMLSSTQLRGKKVLRLCTINPRTNEMDIRKTVKKLNDFGVELENEIRRS